MSLYRVRVKDHPKIGDDTDFYAVAETVMKAGQTVKASLDDRVQRRGLSKYVARIVSITMVSDNVVVDEECPDGCR